MRSGSDGKCCMLPILCPRCKIRVLPSPEGICPGCRKLIPMPVAAAPPVATQECPECKAPLAENAVLCIACGFHLLRGGFLSTAVERSPFSPFTDDQNAAPYANPAPPESSRPPDLNPYASPAILSDFPGHLPLSDDLFVADLTPRAAKRASAIVADAARVYWVILLSLCVCRIAWVLMFPWYGYRLYSWYELNRTYSELRNPTPRRSAHYSLALDFQAAKGRIWTGFIFGSIAFLLMTALMIIGAMSEPSP